jgi:catechol 2,3-dioxygenase
MVPGDAPLRIGKVTLTVRDVESVGRFYEHALGLHLLTKNDGLRQFGVNETILLELHHSPEARLRSRDEAGLFHTAFLLPTRADLGRWINYAVETRLPIHGVADHLVSEAIYLADPEGNGIEIYADRPHSTWQISDGMIQMPSNPLDVVDASKSSGATRWHGFPEGGIIGHVHLQVGAIAPAEAFYSSVLGFDITCRYSGGSFFGAGGYHHHLAANVWNSEGAKVRTYSSTGLADIEIKAGDRSAFEALASRAKRAGVPFERHERGLSIRDPWGTSFTVVSRI